MKTFYSILAVLIFTTSSAFAQKKAIKEFLENAKEIQQRPLKVVLLKEGKEKNDTYNKLIKSAIESEWHINEDYSFISRDEYKDLVKDKSSDFAFLIYFPKSTTTKTSRSPSVKYTTTTFREDGLVLYGYNEKGKKVPVMATDICFENRCSKADYYYSVQDMQNKIYAIANAPASSGKKMKMKDARAMMEKYQKEQQENIKKLENMTLYINEKSLNEKLKKDFEKYYKFDYEIVPIEDIENAIIENNNKIAILYENSIASADTGHAILSFMDMSKMKGFKVTTKAIEAVTSIKELFSHEIQKKDLERLKEVLK